MALLLSLWAKALIYTNIVYFVDNFVNFVSTCFVHLKTGYILIANSHILDALQFFNIGLYA